ncbi:unnamed protein product [Rotaria sordida]|uniref:Uncharacterized protein n=2 Tax=Rotaria sordida TaxID=392033 RepID=A0A819CVL0_9BILA|nr:unnamed protein product [Rotaria sordida]CAF3826556.1 unnamed protein product [Rotaria sordida]
MSSISQGEQGNSQQINAPPSQLSQQYQTPPSTPTPIPSLEEQVYTGGVAEDIMIEQFDINGDSLWNEFQEFVNDYIGDSIVNNMEEEEVVVEEEEEQEQEQEQEEDEMEEQDIENEEYDNDDESNVEDMEEDDNDGESDVEDMEEGNAILITPVSTDDDSDEYVFIDPPVPSFFIDTPDATDEE